MVAKKRISLLLILALISIAIYSFSGLNISNLNYVLSKRLVKILVICLTGGTIAVSSIMFQTITNNRILTPSILGLDAVYMFIQTLVVFLFGANSKVITNNNINFGISTSLMIAFSFLLFKLLFRRENNNIFLLLLVGLICGSLFQSLSSFMQTLIDPKAFQTVQDKMFASFNNVNTNLIIISLIVILIIIICIYDYVDILDVLALGKDQAINLGVDYDKNIKVILIVISILVSISTALVGSITFFGIIASNLTYQVMKTYKHRHILVGSIFLSIIALVLGQFIVERLLNFKTTLSVIINFIGGVYFLYLLLKESRA
ncbi:iron complex transport system permease protein [Clostridium cavendishii DSM 21758]|uniref:Iron complex transport system permease protein n=1 Tax=Clostridium cavendishii DSM 21758 TaxID=1121302 RepID=A0A1M6UM52_9CLOT|nr:iron chelate uptake ABC transporter family permease subunit [Clostridium cavendishii]SHK70325.1 iron complex transport system permease protein [Clostridium cavendishii DSM 21758]